MPLFIAATLLITFCSNAFGEELWVCDGFKSSSDGSTSGPFLMRGDTDFYQWRDEIKEFELKKVGENRVIDFDIYVEVGSNSHRSVY